MEKMMNKPAKTLVDIETYNKIANKMTYIEEKFPQIEAIVKRLLSLAIDFDCGLTPLVHILYNKIESMADTLNRQL